MKKTVLKIVLAVTLVLTLVIGLASCGAAKSKLPDADSANGAIDGTSITWSYDKDDNTLEINGSGEIPDSSSAENVWWHDVRHSVEKIDISDDITAIGDYAFYYFPELEKVTVSENVTRLGDYAFAFCSSLKSVDIEYTESSDGSEADRFKLTEVGEGCFEVCTALEIIFLPSSVTSLGARAFAHCSSLRDATIMAQLKEIAPWTFMGCTSLENKNLIFNKSLEGISVAEDAFENSKITSFKDANFIESETGELTLTVKYAYEDGSEAAADAVSQYKQGDDYSVDSPVIDGFEADNPTVSGIIVSDTSVTVTYKAIATETETETQAPAETEPAPDEEKEGITVTTIIWLVVLGVVLIGIVVLAIVMMRSDKKQSGNNNKNTSNKKK